MINEKYYDGFEGEVEVLFYYYDNKGNQNGFRIWQGYFETLLSGCFLAEPLNTGLLKSYITQEGFYEEKPWKVLDNKTVINELSQFSTSNLEIESLDMIREVEELKNDLVEVVNEAINNQYQVLVDYD
ncbi:hypothetical protein [Clostridium sp. KNHs205]|jgi:hypothetical protein|uniref:hypothetical protein n=1 Tax=Clostridium sp. KNHs205 TaxID=1449050 RepID=UPI00051BAF70|nr:hypothetical protein [Clostridium sp. KNHs205]